MRKCADADVSSRAHMCEQRWNKIIERRRLPAYTVGIQERLGFLFSIIQTYVL